MFDYISVYVQYFHTLYYIKFRLTDVIEIAVQRDQVFETRTAYPLLCETIGLPTEDTSVPHENGQQNSLRIRNIVTINKYLTSQANCSGIALRGAPLNDNQARTQTLTSIKGDKQCNTYYGTSSSSLSSLVLAAPEDEVQASPCDIA